MVRFSCFNAHIGSQKPKESIKSTNMVSFLPGAETTAEIHDSVKPVTDSSSLNHTWKSVVIKDNINLDSSFRVLQNSHYLKKSRSLGSILCLEGRVTGQNDTDDETDQGFSSDSHDHGLFEDDRKNTVESQNGPCSESVQVSSHHVNYEPVFSIGDPQLSEKDCHDISNLPFPCGHGDHHTPNNAPAIVKSSSMPNILASALIFEGHSPSKYLTRCTRSFEDVHVLSMRRKENLIHDVDTEVTREQERDDGMHKNHITNFESPYEGFESYSCSASAKDWIVPVSDELNPVKILQEEFQVLNQNDLTGNDFKIKRIEDWVNDLQHVCPSEDTIELSIPNDLVKVEPTVSNGLTAAKVDIKVTPGMEATKRYISSLSASATTAQLVNHGFVVIPFLSAFVSLKVLNLSGNAIAKITAGALPRGLNMLNLSRNNVSTIEGLRELTRLRVLNLSYNRIFRIGHGLASCSSLKELYLAGNKISEVEGLHRLLKLTVLDLRFNKISTAKCLGQLAANYNSLQAISLEGNPAQKNVGDEYLKKHLQGLLPNLVYFNRQAIKVSAIKDGAERSVRLGISGHQFERRLRSENRATRKKRHGTSTRRPSSSTTHDHKSQAMPSPMQSRGRHGRHPPRGMKVATNHQNQYDDLDSKLLNFKSGLSMRRTQSEGTLQHM